MITRPKQSRIDNGMWWDRAYGLVDGCTPCSPGCLHCWSATETHMRRNHPCDAIRARKHGLTDSTGKFNGLVRMSHDLLNKPNETKSPQVWSIWNDLFHDDIPNLFRHKVVCVIRNNPNDLFLCLTKRPKNMMEYVNSYYSQVPGNLGDNVYIGVTVCNQKEADEKIPILLQIPAAKRFVSYEPALGWVDFNVDIGHGVGELALESGLLHQIICGAESGPNRRHMDVEWARSAAEQCKESGVSFFMKQLSIDGKIVKDIDRFPLELQRREFPGE